MVLVVGDLQGGFHEKLLEASPMLDEANVSRLQEGPATGQGWPWQHLWDNIFYGIIE